MFYPGCTQSLSYICKATTQELNFVYIQWHKKKQAVRVSFFYLWIFLHVFLSVFPKSKYSLFRAAETAWCYLYEIPNLRGRQAINRLELFTDIYGLSDAICYSRAITAERYVQDVQGVAWCYASSAPARLAEKLQWSVAKMLTRAYVYHFHWNIFWIIGDPCGRRWFQNALFMQNLLNHRVNSKVIHSIMPHCSFIISANVNIAAFLFNQFLDDGGVLQAIME